jgi:hypothetical protein
LARCNEESLTTKDTNTDTMFKQGKLIPLRSMSGMVLMEKLGFSDPFHPEFSPP